MLAEHLIQEWLLVVGVLAVILTLLAMAIGGARIVGEMKAETRELKATVMMLAKAAGKLDDTMVRIFERLESNTTDIAIQNMKINGIETHLRANDRHKGGSGADPR